MERYFSLSARERETLRARLTEKLKQKGEIIFALLFGSFNKGEIFRDIDVGIYLRRETIKRSQTLDYEITLETELEKLIRYPVDIRILNFAPLPLCYEASTGSKLFSRDDEFFYDWLEKTWDMYLDSQYFYRSNLRDLVTLNNEES